MLLGKCALTRFRGDEPRPHYWVIIAETKHKVLAVNLTTAWGTPSEDHTCVFEKGDYPLVTKKSYILYGKATLLDKETVTNKQFIDIDPEMFAKILAGAKKSAAIKAEYKHLMD